MHSRHNFPLGILEAGLHIGGLHTGGTLINALPLLGDTPFLAINADIFTDYDFSKITCPENSLAHLVLIEKPAAYKTLEPTPLNLALCTVLL